MREKTNLIKYEVRDVAVIEVLFATGARIYEVSNIRVDSTNLNTGLIRFMGKGGSEDTFKLVIHQFCKF